MVVMVVVVVVTAAAAAVAAAVVVVTGGRGNERQRTFGPRRQIVGLELNLVGLALARGGHRSRSGRSEGVVVAPLHVHVPRRDPGGDGLRTHGARDRDALRRE